MSSNAGRRSRVLVATPADVRQRLFTPEMWRTLEEIADVDVNPSGGDLTTDSAKGLLAEAEIVVTGWGTHVSDRDWVLAAPRLRAVVHTAGSVRLLIDEHTLARGIQVSTQAEQNGRPVAEYSLAMILLAAKGVFRIEREFRATRRNYPLDDVTSGNYGARVGIVGASKIGRRLLQLLEPFDFDVQVYDPYLGAAEAASLGVRLVDLDDLFASSDVVSLHAPLLPSTERMIGARQLQLLPDGAVLINTARGGLIDQVALESQLQDDRIDAVLDVTDPEVLPPDSSLWELPNVVLTPHMAGSVGNELTRLGREAVEEVRRLVAGQNLRYPLAPHEFHITA